VQVKNNQVLRVVPYENEDVNECWIADRDRFSYESLNSDARLTAPMIKQGGQWQTVDWPTALGYVADGLKRVKAEFGVAGIGALGHAGSTVEELHLLAKLVRSLGSESVDHRTRHADFTHTGGVRWLGTSIASLTKLDRALVVGSFLRKDHPLFAQRLRQAARQGAEIHAVSALADDWLLPVASRITAAPSGWVGALAAIAAGVAKAQGTTAPFAAESTEQGDAIAASLLNGTSKAVLLGNAAAQHPQASTLLALANWIATATGATVGYFGEAGNSVGAQLVGALPGPGGLNAGQMLSQPMKALILLGVEPELDAADATAARAALGGSGLVVALTPFRNAAADVADVLLPISPFTETAGTFVNAEGRVQSFQGVAKPLGETRPGWKVLRVLGDLLGLPGFAQQSADEVLAEALGDQATLASRLSNEAALPSALPVEAAPAFERIADVPIYATDSLVRRALSLQLTADARSPQASLPAQLWADLGLVDGDKVRVSQGGAQAVLAARLDKTLAPTAVRVPAGHVLTAALGASFGAVSVAKA
jgi:NADH-quinone oxidoreductase subunit G